MWQKFFCLCFLLLSGVMFSQTYAQTVEVESLSSFSTANPPASISVKLSEPLELTQDLTLDSGTVIKGNLIDVVSPKRLKRNASFSFKPVKYTDTKGKTGKIPSGILASYTTPTDKKKLAKNAALGVGSYFVKGLSVGAAAIEGAVKNQEDNRFKSSAVAAYESSPLSYVEKGQDIEIKEAQIFYLKFYQKRNKDKSNENKGQNYTYTIEKE